MADQRASEPPVTRAKPMPISDQLKFINIWLREDLNNWLQVYAAHLLVDADVKTEETAVNEFSKFSKIDYHHLRTLAHLCDIKLKRIEMGLLGKWYDRAMEMAKNDEETREVIEEQYQKTLSLQTKKQVQYKWVIACLKYQKALRAPEAKPSEEAPPSLMEPQAATQRQKINVTPPNKATASRLAALRKKLAA